MNLSDIKEELLGLSFQRYPKQAICDTFTYVELMQIIQNEIEVKPNLRHSEALYLTDFQKKLDILSRIAEYLEGKVPILVRPHRGGLAESIKETKVIYEKQELTLWARNVFYDNSITDDMIHFDEKSVYDLRTEWSSRYVCIKGLADYDCPPPLALANGILDN